MRPPWWKRLPGGPPAIELDPDAFGARVAAGQRKAIRTTPPPNPENPDEYPWLPDVDRLNLWKGLAQSRLAVILDLRARNTRLRADLDLARNLAASPVDCGHETTLRRYDHDLAVCQREHVDEIDRLNAQLNRLRALAVARERAPF